VLSDEDLRRQYDVRWKMENELPSTMAEHHATSCEWARMRYSEAQTVAVRARAAAREVSVGCFFSFVVIARLHDARSERAQPSTICFLSAVSPLLAVLQY